MTSEEFVMNFRKEKDYMLNMYFDETSDSYTGELISNLVKKGADTAEIKNF